MFRGRIVYQGREVTSAMATSASVLGNLSRLFIDLQLVISNILNLPNIKISDIRLTKSRGFLIIEVIDHQVVIFSTPVLFQFVHCAPLGICYLLQNKG